MKVLHAVILAFWMTFAQLLGLTAGTLTVVPMAMEQQVALNIVPFLFAAIAASGSVLGAFVARMFRPVRKAYSFGRLVLAGCVGWPVAWWLGVETRDALEQAGSHGIFAISATITHVVAGSAVVACIALAVLLARGGNANPRGAAPVHGQS